MNNPWKVICAFLGVFLAGAIFGGMVALRVSDGQEKMHHKSKGSFSSRLMKHYTERLELSPVQIGKIQPILAAADAELRELRVAGYKSTFAVVERMNQAVSAELSAEQRVKFDQFNREMRERWRDSQKNRGKESPDRKKAPPPPTKGGPPPPGR